MSVLSLISFLAWLPSYFPAEITLFNIADADVLSPLEVFIPKLNPLE